MTRNLVFVLFAKESSVIEKLLETTHKNYWQQQGKNFTENTASSTEDDRTSQYAEDSFSAAPATSSYCMLQLGNPSRSQSNMSNNGESDCNESIICSRRNSDSSQNDLPQISDDNDPVDPEVHKPVNVGEDKIREFVLRTLLSKVDHGWSQEEIMAQI